MSSDTSIWIAKFPDWRRHTGVIQAVENIIERELYDTKQERIEEVRSYRWSKPFKTYRWCMRSAIRTQNKYEDDDDYYLPLEYGIVDVWTFDFNLLTN